jgi:cytochrome d ubiquinol oxidase subunit I
MDALVLARMQFASNISFHILFPTINIALAWFLLFVKWRYRRTGDDTWMAIYRLWVKVFALSFALGVVSGIVMSFQFGTNWPGFMLTVGNIAGPLLAYEVLTAFFLEAGFLGIMLFGVGRVSPRVHTLATLLVAIGTTLSAFWILALSSWMHTPAGFEMQGGVAHATNWLQILFSPSFPYRFTHMLLASGLTVSFLVAGISAWRWLRGDAGADVRLSLRTASVLAAILIPLQILAGDLHGLNTLEHQPAKIAAIEAIWHDERNAGLNLFAWPDEGARANLFSIAVPRLGSLILTHSLDGEIRGLNSFPDAHPPVKPLFFGFRLMVGIGMLMLLLSWTTLWLWRRRCGALPRGCLNGWVGMTFAGWIATLAGWYVTEIGRQPYLVYGVLKTADAASTTPAPMIALSLGLYLTVYTALLVAYIRVLYVLAARAATYAPGALGVADDPIATTRSVIEVLP